MADAAQLYSLLSIGDGLVSQIPALIVSTAAGMVVTRTASGGELGRGNQQTAVLESQGACTWSRVFSALFMFVPGFPAIPFFLAAALMLGGAAYYMAKQETPEAEEMLAAETNRRAAKEEPMRPQPVDLLELEVGYELIPLVDGEKGGGGGTHSRACAASSSPTKVFSCRRFISATICAWAAKNIVILVKGVEAGKGELETGTVAGDECHRRGARSRAA